MTPKRQTIPAEEQSRFFDEYGRDRWKYKLLADLATRFLDYQARQIFENERLPVLQKFESRTKENVSLQLNFEAQHYQELTDIKDLAASRLIFFFSEDVDKFADSIRVEQWFGQHAKTTFHKVNSEDRKREYRSTHFTLEVDQASEFYNALAPEDRQNLIGLFCEVQLRTVFQHAWAETEHDLRYKRNRCNSEVSDEVNDLFSKLADLVQKSDAILIAARECLASGTASAPGSSVSGDAGWSYTPLEGGVEINEVRYAYAMSLSDGSEAVPSLREDSQMFDLDKKMKQCHLIDGYKKTVWEYLCKNEPEFMSTITHDTTVVRVSSWNNAQSTLTVQPAHYSDQVVTNHIKALKVELRDGRRVSDLNLDMEGNIFSLEESPFSNTVGISCVISVRGQWLISGRSTFVAYEPGKWGCSASGALEWTELGQWGKRDFTNWFAGGMCREIFEELKYDAKPERLAYLGLGRELGRSGKPQCFFYLDIEDKEVSDIKAAWETYRTPKQEFKELRFITDADASLLVGSDPDSIRKVIKSDKVGEELRINLALALRYRRLRSASEAVAKSNP